MTNRDKFDQTHQKSWAE